MSKGRRDDPAAGATLSHIEPSEEHVFRNAYAEASQPSGMGKGAFPIKTEARQDEPAKNRYDPEPEPAGAAEKTRTAPQSPLFCNACPQVHSQRLLKPKQAAEYLGMSESTLWRLYEKNPRFPRPIKLGGSTRWDKRAIDRYIDMLNLEAEAQG